jgi:hypothetical protein
MAKVSLQLAPRNDPIGIGQRAWNNLRLIEQLYDVHKEGHVVTQLVQSVLTIIIFPKEKKFFDHIAHCQLRDLEKRGWPRPKQVIGKTDTLGQLFRHMRNAVCHGLMKFYGDSKDGANSRDLSKISIEFSDRNKDKAPIHWQVIMEGPELRLFLYYIVDYLNDGSPEGL